MVRVSICLPTWNGATELARLLPLLARQRVDGGLEIVALDSNSSDGTRVLLEAAGARIEVIPQADFRHGPARNRLARSARGEYCIFLSQDAAPAGDDFVECLLAPFADSRVAGVTARVLPFPADDPLTARTVLDAPEAGAEALRWPASGVDAPAARFNDVASAIRRTVLLEIPFPDVRFGEDSAWAAEAHRRGWATVFEPGAVVHHAHRYGPRSAFQRYRVDAAFQREVHGRRVRSSGWSVLRGFAYEIVRDVQYVAGRRRGWLALLRSPGLRAGQVLGQFWGTRGW